MSRGAYRIRWISIWASLATLSSGSCASNHESRTELGPRIEADHAVARQARESARQELHSEFLRRLKAREREQLSSRPLEELLAILRTEADFSRLESSRYGWNQRFDQAVPELIRLLDDDTEVGLVDTADLIIWSRIERGDLRGYGHGWVVADDLFVRSGRAHWILKEITGVKCAALPIDADASQRAALQARWRAWWHHWQTAASPSPRSSN